MDGGLMHGCAGRRVSGWSVGRMCGWVGAWLLWDVLSQDLVRLSRSGARSLERWVANTVRRSVRSETSGSCAMNSAFPN